MHVKTIERPLSETMLVATNVSKFEFLTILYHKIYHFHISVISAVSALYWKTEKVVFCIVHT